MDAAGQTGILLPMELADYLPIALMTILGIAFAGTLEPDTRKARTL